MKKRKEINELSLKATQKYFNIFRNSMIEKRRKTVFSKVFGAEFYDENVNSSSRGNSRINGKEKLVNILSVKPSNINGVFKDFQNADQDSLWREERLTMPGIMNELRKLNRADIDKRTGKLKTQLRIENFIYNKSQKKDLHLTTSALTSLNKGSQRSNYNLPANSFTPNMNFNNFYSTIRQRSESKNEEEPEITSLQGLLPEPVSIEPTEVAGASILTVKDTQLEYRAANGRESILFHTKELVNKEIAGKLWNKKPKRYSIQLEDQKFLVKQGQENSSKNKLHIDLEEETFPETGQGNDQESACSDLSLTERRMKRGGKYYRGSFIEAMREFQSKLRKAEPDSALRDPNLNEQKRIARSKGLKRENSIVLHKFSFKPKLITANHFRPFGKLL